MTTAPHAIDHAERATRIGASDAASILGLPGSRTAWETWAEKRGLLKPWPGSPSTEMGKRLEPVVLDAAEDDLGLLIRGEVLHAANCGCPIASTLDARVASTGIPVEAKTCGIVGPVYGTWGDSDSDAVPDSYLVQVTIQMVCAESEMAYLYALLGGRGIVRYRILRDDDLAAAIVSKLAAWWDRHIVQGIEPERTEGVPLEVAKRLKKTPCKVVEFDESAMALVGEYESAKAAKSAADKHADAAQAALLLRLGDAEGAALPDGRMLTHIEQFRKGYEVKDSRYRVLRIKKG